MKRVRKARIQQLDEIEAGAVRETRPSKYKGMLRYKKVRGGVHRHGGQTIRKGEILYANQEELSPLVMKGFICLDEEIQEAASGISLGLRDRGNGWYDVINKNSGEKLNDVAMRGKDAAQFITGKKEDNLIEDGIVENEDGEEPDAEDVIGTDAVVTE